MIRSSTVIYEVLRKHDLSPLSYMLCDLIYKYTSVDGYCDKNLGDLGIELNTSTRTMSRYVSELTEKGLIDNIGTKSHPKYRTTPIWFRVAVAETDQVISLEYQKVCADVIEYINNRYNKKYQPRTYEKRFKSILLKKFDGEPITGETMANVFDYCKDQWSEKYQSSVTPEVIFGNKFIEKYLIQYKEWMTSNKVTPNRKRVAII